MPAVLINIHMAHRRSKLTPRIDTHHDYEDRRDQQDFKNTPYQLDPAENLYDISSVTSNQVHCSIDFP